MNETPPDYSLRNLEKCSYRTLQQISKSMGLPSNVKKIYLVQLINAKVNLTETEVEQIVNNVKLERQQLALNSKKKGSQRKKSSVQGPEVSSTRTSGQSPPIFPTPKRPGMVVRCKHSSPLIAYSTHKKLEPTVYRTRQSDRVLRSFNMKAYRKPYSFLKNNVHLGRSPKAKKTLEKPHVIETSPELKHSNMNYSARSLVKKYMPGPGVSGQGRSLEGRQLVVMCKDVSTSPPPPIRLLKKTNGLFTITSPETTKSFDCTQSIGFRRSDGKISKINALVQKSSQNKYQHEFDTQNSYRNAEVTVQDIINSNIDAQTFTNPVSEYVLTDSSANYPRVSEFNLNNRQNIQRVTETNAKTVAKMIESIANTSKNSSMSRVSTKVSKATPKRCPILLRKSESNAKNVAEVIESLAINTNLSMMTESMVSSPSHVSRMECIASYPNMSKMAESKKNSYPKMARMTEFDRNNYPKLKRLVESKTNGHPNLSRITESKTNISRMSESTRNNYPNPSSLVVSIANTQPNMLKLTESRAISSRPQQLNTTSSSAISRSTQNMTKVSEMMLIDYPDMSKSSENSGKLVETNATNISQSEVNVIDYPNMSKVTETDTNIHQNMSELSSGITNNHPKVSKPTATITTYSQMSSFTETDTNNHQILSVVPEDTTFNCHDILLLTEIYTNYCQSLTYVTASITNYPEKEIYQPMSGLTDMVPLNTRGISNELTGDFSGYNHKKIPAEQVMSQGKSVGEERLPKINEVFSMFKDFAKDVSQPLYVQVGDEAEISSPDPAFMDHTNNTTMLESLYNFKSQFLVTAPLGQVTTTTTSSVYSSPIVATAVAQTTAMTAEYQVSSSELGNESANDEVSGLYQINQPAEQEMALYQYYQVQDTSESSMDSQDVTMASIPEMMEDALELVSQDGDYMERMQMDVRMQCILCSWAGPKLLLDFHIRKEHLNYIQREIKNTWNITFKLGTLVNQQIWLSQVTEFDSQLYVLSVKYEDPDCFMAALTSLSPTLDTKVGSITIYNKVTGEPYFWSGEIQELPSNMPYENDTQCLKVELSRLELLPNSARLKLVNRELLVTSQAKAVVGRPDLNDIHIIMFVEVFC